MNYNDSYDNDMNYILKNGDVIRGYGSINRDNLSQFIESSNLNDMNRGVETFDVSCGHWYMNSNTIYEAKNPNFMDSTKKRNENAPNLSTMKNTGLKDGDGIDVMLPASTLHQYANMEYKNEYCYHLMNGEG